MFELFIIMAIVVGTFLASIAIATYIRIYQLECDAKLVIEEYRAKLNGSNRFLFDENIMRNVFPNYSHYVVHKVWSRLVMTKAIERDSMDGTWCIK